jgi:hypothetical protein
MFLGFEAINGRLEVLDFVLTEKRKRKYIYSPKRYPKKKEKNSLSSLLRNRPHIPLLKNPNLFLISFQSKRPFPSQFLRPIRILLQHIMSLGKPHQSLNQRSIIIDQRLNLSCERFDGECSIVMDRRGGDLTCCVVEGFEGPDVEFGEGGYGTWAWTAGA